MNKYEVTIERTVFETIVVEAESYFAAQNIKKELEEKEFDTTPIMTTFKVIDAKELPESDNRKAEIRVSDGWGVESRTSKGMKTKFV